MKLKEWLQTTKIAGKIEYGINSAALYQFDLIKLSILMDEEIETVKIKRLEEKTYVHIVTKRNFNDIFGKGE